MHPNKSAIRENTCFGHSHSGDQNKDMFKVVTRAYKTQMTRNEGNAMLVLLVNHIIVDCISLR